MDALVTLFRSENVFFCVVAMSLYTFQAKISNVMGLFYCRRLVLFVSSDAKNCTHAHLLFDFLSRFTNFEDAGS